MPERVKITAANVKILVALFNRKKMSLRGIPGELGLTTREFSTRVKTLRETGIITGWPVVVNPWATGGFRVLFFFIKTNPTEPLVMEELLASGGSHLEDLDGITGDYSLLAKFSVTGRDEQRVLDLVAALDAISSRARFQRYKIVEAISIYKHGGFRHDPRVKRQLKDQEVEFLTELTELCAEHPVPPTTAWVGKQTGKNQSTVSRMMNKLLEAGAITAFSVKTAVSQQMNKFHVNLKAEPSSLPELVEQLAGKPEITSLYRTGQEYGLLLTAFLPAFNDFSRFLKDLYRLEGVVDTLSMPVIDREIKKEPLLPSWKEGNHPS